MNKHETRVGKTESIFKAFENHHHRSKFKQSRRAPQEYIKAQLFCLKNQMTVKELEPRRKQTVHQHIYPQSRNTSYCTWGFSKALQRQKQYKTLLFGPYWQKLCFDYSFKTDGKLWKKSTWTLKHLEKKKVLLSHWFYIIQDDTTHQKMRARPQRLTSCFDEALISKRHF